MKTWVKRSLFGVFLAAFGAGMFLLLRVSSARQSEIALESIQVDMRDSLKFIGRQDVLDLLEASYGTLCGVRAQEVDLVGIERKVLTSMKCVSLCEAWMTDDGVLHVSIRQRVPALRFVKGDSGFYTDASGNTFPLQGTAPAGVLEVGGDITRAFDGDYLGELLRSVEKVRSSEAFRRTLGGVLIGQGGEIVIVDRDSRKFSIGKPDSNLQRMLSKCSKFYTKILPKEDYDYIDVKYNNQIICRKDIQQQ